MAGDDDSYNVDHARRGKALIIINCNFAKARHRQGQEKDAAEIEAVISPLGFEVSKSFDLTTTEMLKQITAVAKEDHSDRDCFLFCLSTHGSSMEEADGMYDQVYGTNGPIAVEMLLEPLRAQKCPSLAGKPKLFFIQACRGDNLMENMKLMSIKDTGKVTDAKSDKSCGPTFFPDLENIPYRVPIYKDFLLAYSVPPGYLAFKTGNGAPFIKYLCERLESEGSTTDILTLLTRVNRDTATKYESNAPSSAGKHQRRMIPWVASMLTKDLIFKPKNEKST